MFPSKDLCFRQLFQFLPAIFHAGGAYKLTTVTREIYIFHILPSSLRISLPCDASIDGSASGETTALPMKNNNIIIARKETSENDACGASHSQF